MNNKWKNRNGKFYLSSLFLETRRFDDPIDPVYTLKDADHEWRDQILPSAKRLYLEEADLTEYNFATKYLGGWRHFQQLTTQQWFKPYLDEWRKELIAKIKSEALKTILIKSKDNNSKDGLSAAKFVMTDGWIPKDIPVRGRPTKDEVLGELKRTAEDERQITEDFLRIQEIQERLN